MPAGDKIGAKFRESRLFNTKMRNGLNASGVALSHFFISFNYFYNFLNERGDKIEWSELKRQGPHLMESKFSYMSTSLHISRILS